MSTEIWILESLRANDTKTGRILSDAVSGRDNRSNPGLKVEFRNPYTPTDFLTNLDQMLSSANAGNFPILHIEAHGNEDGLQLSSGGILDWEDLLDRLVGINDRLRANLVVTVAACSGAHMARTALASTRAPFRAVVGPGTTITADELLNDFTEFYFEFDKTRSMTKARWALNAFKTFKGNYHFSTAEHIFVQLYKDRVLQHLSVEQRNDRIEKLTKRLLDTGQSCDATTARNVAEQIVLNPRETARSAWEKFVFIDKYPENANVFTFPFERVQI